MALEHVNRRGDVYYVLQGKTKTGKPKYYASKKNHGMSVESLPPEFEIFEHADSAMVSIRKRKPSRILPRQRDLICDRIRELTDLEFFRVDIDGDNLIVYIPDRNPNDVAKLLGKILGPLGSSTSRVQEWTVQNCRYYAELKFTLTDASRQKFSASRWCYHGSIDGWITLRTGKALEELADMYLPHLGQESFFDLM